MGGTCTRPGSLIDKNTSVMTDKELDRVAKAVADRLGVNSKEVLTAREACRYMGALHTATWEN